MSMRRMTRFTSRLPVLLVLDILDVQKILSKFFLGDEVRRLVIVISELPDRPNIGFLSSLREASELQTLDHSLSQFGNNYTSGLEYWRTEV